VIAWLARTSSVVHGDLSTVGARNLASRAHPATRTRYTRGLIISIRIGTNATIVAIIHTQRNVAARARPAIVTHAREIVAGVAFTVITAVQRLAFCEDRGGAGAAVHTNVRAGARAPLILAAIAREASKGIAVTNAGGGVADTRSVAETVAAHACVARLAHTALLLVHEGSVNAGQLTRLSSRIGEAHAAASLR
jgi:hypothetical protein